LIDLLIIRTFFVAVLANRWEQAAACGGRVSLKGRRALSPKNSPRLSRPGAGTAATQPDDEVLSLGVRR